MSQSAMLEVKNISFSINQNRLFQNLSFSLSAGQAVHIKGTNGSGKSSLLRILLGISSASKGDVIWKDTSDKVFLGHKNVLKNYLTVADNLYLHGLDITHSKVKSILKDLNLHNKIDLLVGSLSYGQQKKLALVRIFLNTSKVIILDEPCVGLDDQTRLFITSFLCSELNKSKSIIFTSHIPLEIPSTEVIIGRL
jgi:heme exporter protein A